MKSPFGRGIKGTKTRTIPHFDLEPVASRLPKKKKILNQNKQRICKKQEKKNIGLILPNITKYISFLYCKIHYTIRRKTCKHLYPSYYNRMMNNYNREEEEEEKFSCIKSPPDVANCLFNKKKTLLDKYCFGLLEITNLHELISP